MSASDASDLGQSVGGYQLVAVLGRGGMGAVYLAEHPVLKRRVAIKVILSELAGSEEMRERFFDEARLVAELKDPTFVEVLDLATLDDGRPYIMMEFLDGESLGAMLRRLGGALPLADAAAVVVAVLDGLAVAHDKQVVHRDIKPGNLFVVSQGDAGRVKILDFGLAKLHTAVAGRTRTGALLGTPGYMAPEQSTTGKVVDHRADIYAVGVVLYELLAGKPPFHSDDWVDLLHMHRTAEVPVIASALPEIMAVITRALAKRPDDRFATAKEMADALRPHAGHVPKPAAEQPLVVPQERLSQIVAASKATKAGKLKPPAPAEPAQAAENATRALGRKRDEAPPPEAPISSSSGRQGVRIGLTVAAVGAAIAGTAFVTSRRGSSSEHVATTTPRDAGVIGSAVVQHDASPVETSNILDAAVAEALAVTPRADAGAGVGDRARRDGGVAVAANVESSSTEAQEPTKKYWLEYDIPTEKAWDFKARLGWVTERVHKIYPDAKLVHIGGSGLAPDGTIDLTNAASSIAYTFRSPSHTPKTKPGGQMFECLVGVRIAAGSVPVGPANSGWHGPGVAAPGWPLG